jgi:hypothetical protein
MNSQSRKKIIDLNTNTDRDHHNITIYGVDNYDYTGNVISSGDINGDNINDLIICTPGGSGLNNYRYYCGEVAVIFGNTTPAPILHLASQPDLFFYGAGPWDQLGYAVAIGDVNGDDTDDLLLSAPYADGEGNGRYDSGEVYIFYGNESFPAVWDLTTKPANVTIYGNETYDSIGISLATGDINGDDIDDIIIGTYLADGFNNSKYNCGEVYVVYGNYSLNSTIDLATSGNVTIYGVDTNDYFGSSVAAGDVNNDGYDDLLMGARNAAGIGNTKYSSGEVYVIFGNDSLNSTIDLAEPWANVTIFGIDTSDIMGSVIASGNINDDAYDDIIISSMYGDGVSNSKLNCGEVYVIFGNSSLERYISALNANLMIYGQENTDYMGSSLATGDVNGDNIDDLIIGAPAADGAVIYGYNCGEAYVINGSSSLPSSIDLSVQAPFITIHGAEGSEWWGGDIGDRAGSAVLISDLNGDNKGDIVIGASYAKGRQNANRYSGEVYVILSGGKLMPIPIINSVHLENGVEADKKTCYARYYPYLFSVKIIVPNALEDLNTVTLNLEPGIPAQNLQYVWSEATKEFAELIDNNNYGEICPQSNYYNFAGNIWSINFHIRFNWTYPDSILHSVQVNATSDAGYSDGIISNGLYRIKNGLNFKGNLTVTGETQGELSKGAWVHKEELLTWGGLKVVYNGTDDIYPPTDSGMTVTVWDSLGGNWTAGAGGNNEIEVETIAANETRINDKHIICISGVPPYCDKSQQITFSLNIDADRVVFSNQFPDNKSWSVIQRPSCGIRFEDLATNVNSSSVQYRISTDNNDTWSDWTAVGIIAYYSGKGLNCTVKPIFIDGSDNLIQWRATDIVGNNYTESDAFRILVDVSNVNFLNPSPSSDAWQSRLRITCSITITDELSGVNASSIEYSTSTNGIWGYDDWQSARLTGYEDTINCTVIPVFEEGLENYIRWRAADVAGNPYRISDNYQIKIRLNNPPQSSLISPVNKSIISKLTPTLVWSGLDVDNNTELSYDVYLSSDENKVLALNESTMVISNTINSTFELNFSLMDDKTYYWTVIPYDGIDRGKCESNIWEFRVDTLVITPSVSLASPSNNDIVPTLTPKLIWGLNYPNPNIITYELYLGASPFTDELLIEENRLVSEYKLTTFLVNTPLTPGESYYWTVLPIAHLPEGIVRGDCKSGTWSFKVDLPIEKMFGLTLELADQSLSVAQGNYTSTTITITNLGNTVDMIGISVDKGILEANVALEKSGTLIRLDSNEQITLKLEILVSTNAKPQNYTITITAVSNGALSEALEVSETKSLMLRVIEKEKEPSDVIDDDGAQDIGKEQDELSATEIALWSVIIIILIIILGLFLYIYRANKAKQIPLVESELLYKPPEKLALKGLDIKPGEEGELPAGAGVIPTITGQPTIPVQYQLPRAILTKEQKLELLEERFLLGEVTEETYKELKEKLESGKEKDITAEEGEAPVDETTEPVKAEDVPVEAEAPPVTEDIEAKEEKELEKVEEQAKEPEEIEAKELETTLETTGEMEDKSKVEPIKPSVTPMGKGELPVKKKKKPRKKKKVLEQKSDDSAMKEQKIDKEVYNQELQKEHETPEALPWNDGECIKCGESLKLHSEYCWNCGTKYKVRKKPKMIAK